MQLAKFEHKTSILNDHENVFHWIFFGIFFNQILKLYFHLPSNIVYMNSRKKSGCIYRFFSVNQFENNDSSQNEESTTYCLLTQ